MYVGRFAPTPSGPLHIGSITTAIASFCDAKKNSGKWLIRFDDLDQQRSKVAFASDILRTLESFSLIWDDTPSYQSKNNSLYSEWLSSPAILQNTYFCECSRKTIKDKTPDFTDEPVYLGSCRDKNINPKNAHNIRFKLQNSQVISINDLILGEVTENLSATSGDFVIAKPTGYVTYHLASVIDDHSHGVTHIIRGYDLLRSSLRQVLLQQNLRLTLPAYAHLPLVKNSLGQKLSKQNKAEPVDVRLKSLIFFEALNFLGQNPPAHLKNDDVESIKNWAIANWQLEKVKA